MLSSHLALRATNYENIEAYIQTAPSCATDCQETFWDRYRDSCDGDDDWECLCAYGPQGNPTGAELAWLQESQTCMAQSCSIGEMAAVDATRADLASFCRNYLASPSATSSPSTTRSPSPTSTTTRMSTMSTPITNSTITTRTRTSTSTILTSSSVNSTMTTSTTTSTSSSSTPTAAVTRVPPGDFDARPDNSQGPSFLPSKSLIILGSLWLSLAVLAHV